MGQGAPPELHGFGEIALAGRVTDDRLQPDDFLLNEVRFRLDLSHSGDRAGVAFKGDFTADAVADAVELDVRQAVLSLRAADWLDIRAGRQVLTWGTGDLLFLNDLFPKDFVSFFVGRDDEFLKAPSNALKLTLYSPAANLDVVWTPVFEPDRFITGERLSFFDPQAGRLVSATTMGGPLRAVRPAREFGSGELAVRVFRTLGGWELALYGYAGFTKQPQAFDVALDLAAHSRLAVYGASVRGNLAGGIASLESAYYDGADDSGNDPNVPNSQLRGLIGYERELLPELTGGFQYYLERTQDHDRLIASSRAPRFEPPEARHLLTARLTYRAMQQTLMVSLFAFASPNEQDVHLRSTLSYQWTDAVTVALGANVMFGDEATFFGQLKRASNVYVRGRYSF